MSAGAERGASRRYLLVSVTLFVVGLALIVGAWLLPQGNLVAGIAAVLCVSASIFVRAYATWPRSHR